MLAEDEGAIAANPVRKVPAPKRRVDPDLVFAEAKRRALTPEEAGLLLARLPLFWWDHVLCLLGTGLRSGEFAGLRVRRIHLDRAIPVLQVVDTRYQAGRYGSGFKPRPKSDAGIPARVIDELMGHQRSRHGALDGGSRIGARYRHTTDAMALRVVEAIQERLTTALRVAEDTQANRQGTRRVL
jgi:hypothetical protein